MGNANKKGLPFVAWLNEGLSPDGIYRARVQSMSRKGLSYEIQVDSEGHVSCSCDSFFFNYRKHKPELKDGACCKHIDFIRKHLKAQCRQAFRHITRAA